MQVAADFSGSPNYSFNSQLEYGQMEDLAVTIDNSTLPISFGDITNVFKEGHLLVNWSRIMEINNSHLK